MTSIFSTRESSKDFLISISPDSTSTGSEKVSSILLLTPIATSLSKGLDELKVGGVTSAVVKDNEFLSLIPD